MNEFSTEQFLNHIKQVDADLRLMALFDLRQYVTKTGRAPSEIDSIIVRKTLDCLSADEKKEEVRQEAVSTIPPLSVACSVRDQLTILETLLEATTLSPASARDRPAFLELQDLSCLTLKAAVSAIASASQRDVPYWQSEIDPIRKYTALCGKALDSSEELAGKETVYNTLQTLIPVFGSALESEVVDALLTRSFADVQVVTALRRVAIPCCSLLAPYTTETVLARILDSLLAELAKPSADVFAVHLQLCEALLRTSADLMRARVVPIVECVVAALKDTSETYDSAPDAAEAALRVLELAYAVFPQELVGAATEGAVAVCAELATFDPNYCGDAQVEDGAYEDDYGYEEDYYQDGYYGESIDMTWKLRMGALRALTVITAAVPREAIGLQALKVGVAATQDRVQDAQLAGFSLVSAVLSQPYFRAGSLPSGAFTTIAAWVGGVGDKSALAALAVLEALFRRVAGSARVYGAEAAKILEAVLRDAAPAANARYLAEVCEVSKTIVEMTLADSVDGASRTVPAGTAGLTAASLSLCGTMDQPANSRVVSSVVKGNHLYMELATSAGAAAGAAVAQQTVGTLSEMVSSTSVDGGCRCAAVEALCSWACASSFDAEARAAFDSLAACFAEKSLRSSVLRGLTSHWLPPEAATRVPQAFVVQVSDVLKDPTTGAADRSAAADMAAHLSECSVPVPPKAWATWVAVAEDAVKQCQQAGPAHTEDEPFAWLAAMLRLLSFGAKQRPQDATPSANSVSKTIIAPAWGCLQAHTGVNNSYTDALKGLLALVTVLVPASENPSTTEAVLSFLTRAKAPAQKTCVAAGAALAKDSTEAAVSAFFDKLAAGKVDQSSLSLFVGEAGRVAALPPKYATALLDSVQSDVAELIRTNGEAGIAAAISNPANTALVSECVSRASGGEFVKGRFYYLRALRTALAAAHSAPDRNFASPAQCKSVLNALLAHPVDEDVLELTASCVGAIAQNHPLLCVEAVSAALETKVKEMRVLCASALRFILPGVVAHGQDMAPIERMVVDDLCNDLALTASASVPVKTALLRLLTSQPQWIQGRPAIFAKCLTELRENPKLVGSINIGGYAHRTDKGLEMRKIAFECLAAIMESDRTRGTQIVKSCNHAAELVDALIHACGAAKDGEKETLINNDAKLLLVTFVQQYHDYPLTQAQLQTLCEKFTADFDAAESKRLASERENTLLTYTLFAITRLSKRPVFFHHDMFRILLGRAQTSKLLTMALKMTPV